MTDTQRCPICQSDRPEVRPSTSAERIAFNEIADRQLKRPQPAEVEEETVESCRAASMCHVCGYAIGIARRYRRYYDTRYRTCDHECHQARRVGQPVEPGELERLRFSFLRVLEDELTKRGERGSSDRALAALIAAERADAVKGMHLSKEECDCKRPSTCDGCWQKPPEHPMHPGPRCLAARKGEGG